MTYFPRIEGIVLLNRTKNQLLQMLDTLGKALTQYLAQPTGELFEAIDGFIERINALIAEESAEAIEMSGRLRRALETPNPCQIEQLYRGVCSEIERLPVQYKVVFLPYYDNTWDSLASVYAAFAADSRFVTEIVIIPIVRNSPTGQKIVYRDYLTPKGIPNTPFPDYHFEEDLPDFVFYSNPYDGTMIKKFQSQTIRPYIGCMVYVPYFLYMHYVLNESALERQTEQYTELSGHDCADIFVVQGKTFLERYSRRSRNGEKMVALGNPKTDILYNGRDQYPRYREWDEIVDGKTVFMLNTHYGSAARGTYKPFLSNVFEYIEQNPDTALIWRPHPQSFLMFDEHDTSENYLEWQRCLEYADGHDRMILDRSESDISAIMYSDAVVSQPSSVVVEALFVDKPVFVLTRNPKEAEPAQSWSTMTIEQYMKKVKQARKYDINNLFLLSAVCYMGINKPVRKEEITPEYWWKVPMYEFMDDIRQGIDTKKRLRALFCRQSLLNRDGTCGRKIHDYIVKILDTPGAFS